MSATRLVRRLLRLVRMSGRTSSSATGVSRRTSTRSATAIPVLTPPDLRVIDRACRTSPDAVPHALASEQLTQLDSSLTPGARTEPESNPGHAVVRGYQ
jgi:hypothetical protein